MLQSRSFFGDAKVFLCFFPPNMTDIIQSIDAGLGRSLRCAIGRLLDEWLMDGRNLEKWEANMTAMERRILITNQVGDAMTYVMSEEQDHMRVGCFERTGCLITLLANEEHDKKI